MQKAIFYFTLFFIGINWGNIISTANATVRDSIAANNNLIEYTGRIDFSDSLAPKFSFSGISIRANFTGTSISAIMDEDQGPNYYNALIDGQVYNVFNTSMGKKEYVLATELEDTVHEIELFKRTELSFGKNQFYGFILDEGKTLLPIENERELLIEYIGNSITCGYGNEGTSDDDFTAETENHFLTYAAITSRNFNAHHMAVSRSGIGVYRNYNGPAEGNNDCMTNLYTNVFLYDDEPKYDFAVQPDLVCINLGTNDFSTEGGDSALYTDAYFRLIDTIQTKYEDPHILLLLGSMMSGGTLNNVREYLQFIADSATSNGNGEVSFFEMSAQTGDLGIGVHWHPTVAQHQRNAAELTEYIKSLKGWSLKTQVSAATITTSKEVKVTFNTEINQNDEDFSGFSIRKGIQTYTITEATPDSEDAKIINFSIEEDFAPGDTIFLHYEPGTIESTEGVALERFNNIEIENTLSTTIIKSSKVNANGESIKLTFNKTLNPESTVDGLSFSVNNETVAIDSFSISTRYLTCYTSIIMEGDVVTADYNGNNIIGEDNLALEVFSGMDVENKSNITSVNDRASIKMFKIWPNPNRDGCFYFECDQLNMKSSNYIITNAKGSIVNKGQLNNKNGKIKMDNRSAKGIYYLQIFSKNHTETHELLLMN